MSRTAKRLITELLAENTGGRESFREEEILLTDIVPDGSTRKFYRVTHRSKKLGIAIVTDCKDDNGMREIEAVYRIGSHLKMVGAPVPEIYGWSRQHGTLLYEDLGNMRFHSYLENVNGEQKRVMYEKCLDGLLDMQLSAKQGFLKSWCYDTPVYDDHLMIERESKYFLTAFLNNYLGMDIDFCSLEKDFREIAANCVVEEEKQVFLHRDFQSRNIMINDNNPVFIDFQGGRMGPAGYDLASLLIDPYTGLSDEFQDSLFSYYSTKAVGRIFTDHEQWRKQYEYLALQRNMQVLGAFSFLSRECGKLFFEDYIVPAFTSLKKRLAYSLFDKYEALRNTVFQAESLLM